MVAVTCEVTSQSCVLWHVEVNVKEIFLNTLNVNMFHCRNTTTNMNVIQDGVPVWTVENVAPAF